MSDIRKRIELFFENLSHTLFRHRIKTLILMALFIGITGQFCKDLTVDTATEAMLRKDDPSLITYNEFRDQFGRSEAVAVLVEAPDIFDRDFLIRLKALQEDLKKNTPYLEKITSLINIRNTHGENDVLHVDELIPNPEDADLKTARERALESPFYENYILSADKKSTALIIETVAEVLDKSETPASSKEEDLSGFSDSAIDSIDVSQGKRTSHYITADEKAEVNAAVSNVIEHYRADDFKLTFSGGSVMVDVFNKATIKDITRLVKIMICVILAFLFIMFRRVSGMILPMVIVACATLSTMGLMGLTGTPISIMTNILPAFLVSVCIADAIHVLAIFYREFQAGKSKEDAICFAMGHSGLAIVMTSLTTAAGLLSFAFAEIATIGDMGYFAALGVLLGLLYTIILLPPLMAVIPVVRKAETSTGKSSRRMDRFLLFFGNISIRHPYKIIAISVFLMAVSVFYIFKLQFSNNVLKYFPENHPVKLDLQHLESKISGSMVVEVVVDTKRENGIQDPELLKKLDALISKILTIKTDDLYVGDVISIIDILKETHRALNNNDPAAYVIPDDSKAIAGEMLMFENSKSDDLKKLTDSLYSKTRLSIKTKWADSVVYKHFVDDLAIMFQDAVGDKATVTITGLAALMGRTITAAMISMVESYAIALVVITILMMLLVGELKLGLISMCPNLLPIFMVFGLISLVGITLDINTLFIGSVAIGLVVDDTIHYIYNFRKYFDRCGDAETAIRETFLGTGRALLTTTIVLSMNFFMLIFATLNHSIKFGIFTGISIIFALLADFFLSPALLYLLTRKIQNPVDDEDEDMDEDIGHAVLAESVAR